MRAFTLAEVLITLGIIAIIAAMTLPPIVVKNRNKALEASLKKNYSIILQALAMYQAEHGEPIQTDFLAEQSLKKSLLPYFNVIHDCGYGLKKEEKDASSCGDIEYLEEEYKTFNGKPLNRYYLDNGLFILNDGSLIIIEDNINKFISVDVNGFHKNPNRLGHDLFTFQLMKDGRLVPMGIKGTAFDDLNAYCSQASSNEFNGAGCTYKALTEKDYFNNLPR